MNTVERGNFLELNLFKEFHRLIENNLFLSPASNCKVFRKKGYFSRDRQTDIIFDISIEISMPGAESYSILMLIECKNYSHSVPVDDVEEFFAKTQQISGANIKAIVACTSGFQSGTFAYSKSKGIGLVRYFDDADLKWVLNRSMGASSPKHVTHAEIRDALTNIEFNGSQYNFYGEISDHFTTTINDFFLNLITEDEVNQLFKLRRIRPNAPFRVPFVHEEELEEISHRVRSQIAYIDGAVSLEEICQLENIRSGLKVIYGATRTDSEIEKQVLGKISFTSSEITIFESGHSDPSRLKFTLAHELGHHFLEHSKYINAEYCQETDFLNEAVPAIANRGIRRLELQANVFASCLLLPRDPFLKDFHLLVKRLELGNKGFGVLFLDNQQCNLENFYRITNALKDKYQVSRESIALRLVKLGVLRDCRRTESAGSSFDRPVRMRLPSSADND